jgi:hypothetical protein
MDSIITHPRRMFNLYLTSLHSQNAWPSSFTTGPNKNDTEIIFFIYSRVHGVFLSLQPGTAKLIWAHTNGHQTIQYTVKNSQDTYSVKR